MFTCLMKFTGNLLSSQYIILSKDLKIILILKIKKPCHKQGFKQLKNRNYLINSFLEIPLELFIRYRPGVNPEILTD